MWKQRGSSPQPVLPRDERLRKWWATLDLEQRRHARACVGAGGPDAAFLEQLRASGIGLADVGWVSHNAHGGHIPKALRTFVERQPAD